MCKQGWGRAVQYSAVQYVRTISSAYVDRYSSTVACFLFLANILLVEIHIDAAPLFLATFVLLTFHLVFLLPTRTCWWCQ